MFKNADMADSLNYSFVKFSSHLPAAAKSSTIDKKQWLHVPPVENYPSLSINGTKPQASPDDYDKTSLSISKTVRGSSVITFDPKSPICTISIATRAGARYETVTADAGASHLLKHYAFKVQSYIALLYLYKLV